MSRGTGRFIGEAVKTGLGLTGLARAVAEQIMNPYEREDPIRSPFGGGNEGSMTGRSRQILDLAWNTAANNSGPTTQLTLPKQYAAAFLYWDVVRTVQYSRTCPSADPTHTAWYAYNALFANAERTVNNVDTAPTNPSTAYQYGNFEQETILQPAFFVSSSATTLATAIPGGSSAGGSEVVNPSLAPKQWSPHGQNLPVAYNTAMTKYGVWIDANGDTQPGTNNVSQYGIQIIFSPEHYSRLGSTSKYDIVLYRHDGKDYKFYDQDIGVAQPTAVGGIGYYNFPVSDAGHYAVGVRISTYVAASPASPGPVGFGMAIYSTMQQAMAIVGAEGFDPTWGVGALVGGTKALGASMWWENITNDFVAGGNIVGCTAAPSENMQVNYLNATAASSVTAGDGIYAVVAEKMRASSLQMKNGAFAYHPTADVHAWDWRPTCVQGFSANNNQPLLAQFAYPAQDPQGFVVIVGNYNTTSPNQFNLIVDLNYEYQSQKTLLVKSPPLATEADFIAAQNGLKFAPNVFPNAKHREGIAAILRNVASKGRPLGFRHRAY
jgi:hypothetical protein